MKNLRNVLAIATIALTLATTFVSCEAEPLTDDTTPSKAELILSGFPSGATSPSAIADLSSSKNIAHNSLKHKIRPSKFTAS